MNTPNLDEQIQRLQMYERNDELSDNGKSMLKEYLAIKKQLSKKDFIDSLPSNDEIRLKIYKQTDELDLFNGFSEKETNLCKISLVRGALWMKEEIKAYFL